MLGNAMFRVLSEDRRNDVFATARSTSIKRNFEASLAGKILTGIDAENSDVLAKLFADFKPDVVVNCIGIVKQLAASNDPLVVLPINAMLPHRLARLSGLVGARFIHISTDCVFNGASGNYLETDESNAEDLYGRSKFIGEVGYSNSITLRTSIIGRELSGANGLIDWFLSQNGSVRGYTNAIFSGLPTVELSRVVRDVVLDRPELSGLYHVASHPISKFELLCLVRDVYGKQIEIIPDQSVSIDRSLNADLFQRITGYQSPTWPQLVKLMHEFS
jgi:dTDP-4-dehydrorhamnose reductase